MRRFRKRFGCERVLHADDVTRRHARRRAAARRAANPCASAPDLLAIPTPGHTRGHAVLLYRDKYLFTGDHLAWSRRRGQLVAFRDANWYSWPEQIRSMERLLDHRFEWVLPGPRRLLPGRVAGGRCAARSSAACAWMKSASAGSGGVTFETAGSRRRREAAVPPGSRPRASRTAGVCSAGARMTTQPPPPAPHAFPRPGPRRAARPRSRPRCPATRHDRREPPARLPLPPQRRAHRGESRRASAASAISRAARRDLFQPRGDVAVAFQAGAEDLPVVHSRGVRGARVEERQVPEPRRGLDLAPVGLDVLPEGSAACAARRTAEGSSPGPPRACRARGSRRRARTRPRPGPSKSRPDARRERRRHRHRQRRGASRGPSRTARRTKARSRAARGSRGPRARRPPAPPRGSARSSRGLVDDARSYPSSGTVTRNPARPAAARDTAPADRSPG